ALQSGREQIGLARHVDIEREDILTCANTAFFPGHPDKAHASFERWWHSQAADIDTQVTERVRWPLPESTLAADARRKVKADYPEVAQRLTPSSDGEVMLTFTATSKGKAQGARKALQRTMAANSQALAVSRYWLHVT
ncbi:MAG: hypothetical protein ABIZ64_11030, partial [Casimicrobium sp.]